MTNLPKIWLFWTWEKEYWKWWSWIRVLLEKVGSEDIKANVAVIVSDYENGWVRQKADDAWIEFHHIKDFPKRETSGQRKWEFAPYASHKISLMYKEIIKKYWLEYVFLSWWLKLVLWLDPTKTVNIHPGPTKHPYWWKWMWGMRVHRKVWEDYLEWKINRTCVTMHYVVPWIDEGPIAVQVPVHIIEDCKSPEDVQAKVNVMEHEIQWKVTQMIISGAIKWSWKIGEKVEIDMEVAKSFGFPEWTGFGEEIEL